MLQAKTLPQLAREAFLTTMTIEELDEISGAGPCAPTETCGSGGCNNDGLDGPDNGFPECT